MEKFSFHGLGVDLNLPVLQISISLFILVLMSQVQSVVGFFCEVNCL